MLLCYVISSVQTLPWCPQMSESSSSRYLFTPSQWQELEHQALIYKYMISGTPIPSDLIIPIRRSFFLESTTMATPSLTFPPQSLMGWGCFQLGFGRKVEDLEPGRCKRTDGKKWRCSKEVCPDSKYCEKHKHRGKNHSRKPVEKSFATTILSTMPTHPSTITHSSSHLSSLHNTPTTLSISTPEAYKHVMYPSCSSSSIPQHSCPPLKYFHLDTACYYSADREYRYHHGTKDVDGHCLSSKVSGVQFGSPGMNSLGGKEQKGYSMQQSTCSSHQAMERLEAEEEEERQHCFALGVDIKLGKPVKMNSDQKTQKPLHHFLDNWPQKSKDSWITTKGDDGNPASHSSSHFSIFASERCSKEEPTLEMHFL